MARELLLSLETMTDQEIEDMWIKEAKKHLAGNVRWIQAWLAACLLMGRRHHA